MMKTEITDFGEKIGGAKKELWKERELLEFDISELNSREYSKYITKDNVWRVPDYLKLVNNGLSPVCAYFIKNVRDCLPKKVKDGCSEDIAKKYVEFITQVKTVCLEIREESEIQTAFDRLFVKNGYLKKNSWTKKGLAQPWKTSRLIHYLDRMTSELDCLKSEIEIMGFPYTFRGDLKGIHIRYYIPFTGLRTAGYEIYRNSRPAMTCRSFESKEEAMNYLKTVAIPELDNRRQILAAKRQELREKKEKVIVRPQLKYIIREGPVYKEGNVLPDDFLDTFKFRGGEFGNWNSQQDRQAYLNYAHNAFMDLAKVLDIPADAISLGGFDGRKLSIAFGSRGSGQAMAHYERARVVINLTKMKGAGSVAHEWGHALDDFLGVKLGSTRFLTEQYNLLNKKNNSNRKKVLLKAFRELMSLIKTGKVANVTTDAFAKVSRYYSDAMELDLQEHPGKFYFSMDVELFARAFESYVQDSLEWRSDYLVHGTHMQFNGLNIYPAGEERKKINAAMHLLIQAIKEAGLWGKTDVYNQGIIE